MKFLSFKTSAGIKSGRRATGNGSLINYPWRINYVLKREASIGICTYCEHLR